MKTAITVTWMNNDQETFRAQNWEISDGSLWLTSPNDVSQPARCIPLANVKIWTVGQ